MKYGPLVLALVCLLLGWGLSSRCHSAPPIDQSKPLQASLDSLHAVNAAKIDSLRAADSLSKARAARFESEARNQRQQASRLKRWADSVAHAPQSGAMVPDSGTVPRAAYDSLSVAYDSLEASDSSLKQALREHVLGEGQRETRIMIVEGELSQTRSLFKDLTALYKAELGKRRGRCHIGGAVGYGVVASGGSIHAGPGLTMGISCSL